jgi:indole-3-glycerol phosphate synthase
MFPGETTTMILDKIVENKKREIEERGELYKKLAEKIKKNLPADSSAFKHAFSCAVSCAGKINLIAEIKRFSPSDPIPIRGFDAVDIARVYEAGGASALSVLTDRDYFGGGFEVLASIKNTVGIPVLCKDFIVDELQIYAARHYGADAVLLITGILKDEEMKKFIGLADSLGMSSLVEVHSEDELERAVNSGAKIIGINNRNLDTLEVRLSTTLELIKLIPRGRTIVSESGIKTREDVMKLKDAGVNAILVGGALLRSSDIAAKIKELMTTI